MSNIKRFTRKEINNYNLKTDTVFIIDNLVYDVTKFIDDHPGGHEVLLGVAGKDASENFNDVGHSPDAIEIMEKYMIGELVEEDKVEVKTPKTSWAHTLPETETESSFLSSWKFPVVLGLLMTGLYTYLFG